MADFQARTAGNPRRLQRLILPGAAQRVAICLADRVVVTAPRPGVIKSVVEIDLPHPRQRTGAEFRKLRERLLHQLTGDGDYLPPVAQRVAGMRPELIAL